MKRLTLAVSALALVATGSAVAFAADAPAHRDQALTRAEAQAKAGQLFDRLDVNHDGKLDAADRAARFNAIFDTIDTNHDGQISRDEFLAAHEHMRGMMGGDHMGPDHMGHDGPPPDGEPGMGPMGHERHGAWGEGKGRHGPRGAMLVMAILHQADPQHTGTITRDAFVAAALGLFDKADTNHDGQLTWQERKAAWAAGREHMRQEHEHERGAGHDHAPGDMPPPPPGA